MLQFVAEALRKPVLSCNVDCLTKFILRLKRHLLRTDDLYASVWKAKACLLTFLNAALAHNAGIYQL